MPSAPAPSLRPRLRSRRRPARPRPERRRGVGGSAGDASVALSWTAPASNGGSAITGYRVTPYIGATAQTADPHRVGGDDLHRHRPDERHGLHVHGRRDQRGRHGCRLGGVRRDHAGGSDRSGRADGCRRQRGRRLRRADLDGARLGRRQPDHAATASRRTTGDRADRGPDGLERDELQRHGSHERHGLHVHGRRDQRRRHRRRLGARRRRSRRRRSTRSRSRTALPGDPNWGDFGAPPTPNDLSGYGSKISVNHGQSLDLYVTTTRRERHPRRLPARLVRRRRRAQDGIARHVPRRQPGPGDARTRRPAWSRSTGRRRPR